MLKYSLTNSTVANEETYIKPLLLCHHIQDIVDVLYYVHRQIRLDFNFKFLPFIGARTTYEFTTVGKRL